MTKATHWASVFSTLQSLVDFHVTDNSKENLAGKRRTKRMLKYSELPPLTQQTAPLPTGPSATPQTEDEARRVVSISDPKKSSAGCRLYYACDERVSEALANQFANMALMSLFVNKPRIPWVRGRLNTPVLQWRSKYNPCTPSTHC